jgi:hypothetical protein
MIKDIISFRLGEAPGCQAQLFGQGRPGGASRMSPFRIAADVLSLNPPPVACPGYPPISERHCA